MMRCCGVAIGSVRAVSSVCATDAPIAPIFFYVSKNLVSPKITGWVDNLPDWHLTRYLCFKK